MLDEMDGGLESDFSSQEVRTELGVLTNSDSARDHLPASHGIDHNYSLDDEEEEKNHKGSQRFVAPARTKSNIDWAGRM